MCADGNVRRPEAAQSRRWADQLRGELGWTVYPSSFVIRGGVTAFLAREQTDRRFAMIWPGEPDAMVDAFSGQVRPLTFESVAVKLKSCPTDSANSAALRKYIPFTRPQMLGLAKSFGFGDRLGIATPGHILAATKHNQIKPVFAQQSIREMTRTQRTAQQVMDDACWGVFQSGFDQPFGADADHLKTFDDIDTCLAAGFLMFTIDPGDHVDDGADSGDAKTIERKFQQLPWNDLESSADETVKTYSGTITLDDEPLPFTAEQVKRAAVKYGRAIAHTLSMYRRLLEKTGDGAFELEVSVDETATPTSPQEHYYVAAELKRLGVKWVSLAPRFVGEFEKGVDYIGSLPQFRDDFARHAAIARQLGPYKLSIHSGSDKFSIYPIAAKLTGELIHVKTAGTSYLEAVRVLAQLNPDLFREILDFARDRYPTDRASYHVSADLGNVPPAGDLADHQLPRLLDEFHAREVLHVTFGSVMTMSGPNGPFKQRIMAALCEHEDAYDHCLEGHLGRHLDGLST